MQKYHNVVQSTTGDIITTATITVYLANTGTPATLYQDDEAATYSNPFTSADANYDSNGAFFFKAANSVLDIKIVNGGDTTWIYDVSFLDTDDPLSGNLSVIDSQHIYVGTGNDLDITHGGASSSIANNTGPFYFINQDTSGLVLIDTYNSSDVSKRTAKFGGATPGVSLYYNGIQSASSQSGGIAFNSDTSAANTLDDYEEGTWTPVLSDGTNNATMNIQVASYTKIGRLVTLKIFLGTTSLGSVSGAIRITGLPFTADVTSNSYSAISCGNGGGLAVSAGGTVTGYVFYNATYIILETWDVTTGTSPMQATEWTDDGSVIMTAVYNT